jgi:hypothetical protein
MSSDVQIGDSERSTDKTSDDGTVLCTEILTLELAMKIEADLQNS